MEGPGVRLTLNSPNYVYHTNEDITGVISIWLDRPRKIKAIKVKIEGNGKARWLDVFRRHTNSTSRIMHSNRETYLRHKYTLPEFDSNGLVLLAGEHKFNFTLSVLESRPSSFVGNHGSIKYKLTVYINRSAFGYRRQLQVPLTIYKYQPLSEWARANPTLIEKITVKTVGVFGARPITLTVALPTESAVTGEPLAINATVVNGSSICVEKLRFSFLQNVTYISDSSPPEYRREQFKIAIKETGAINKKSERMFAHELLIPESLPATDVDLSNLINLTYELQVKAVLDGFTKNMVLTFPIVVYSHGPQTNTTTVAAAAATSTTTMRARASITPSVDNISRNPFEESSAVENPPTNHRHSSNDSAAVTELSSPAHSSRSTVSSNSSTSQSTATTLSPSAAANTEELTSSANTNTSTPQGSPQNSSSANSTEPTYCASPSLRIYQTPTHVPYPEGVVAETILSRIWTPGTPPYAVVPGTLPSINSGNLFWPQSSTSLNLRQSEQTQTPPIRRSFLNAQLRPPAENELPPSYDELFGVASAPLADALRD